MASPPLFFLLLALVGLVASAVLLAVAKKRGPSAYVLAAAFAMFALVNLAFYLEWPSWALYGAGGVLAILLLADLALRSALKGNAR
jgi:FtsH-binding integral membrane protein